MCHAPSGVRGPPRVFAVALSFGLPGTREPKMNHAMKPAKTSTTTTTAAVSHLNARRTWSVGDDAESTSHERVDPAEVRVGTRRQVGGRRPRVGTRRGSRGLPELPALEGG